MKILQCKFKHGVESVGIVCTRDLVCCVWWFCFIFLLSDCHAIAKFSQAGLHEWMHFAIFHARSHERSQLPLPGWFFSRQLRRTLCIAVEVEPRFVKQYKCYYCCLCKNYRGKVMGDGKKVSLHCFLADQKIVSSWKKCVLGHPIAWATGYCLSPDTFWLWASKNVFKVGSVKFANSFSPPSIVKKVCTGSKCSQGT